jgi:hypothetical protein
VANYRDMNNANATDKLLLVGNFVVNKNGYDYYKYTIKKFDGTQFTDLILNGGTAWSALGNNIGFQKVASSNYYVFYVDQSTQYSYGLPDKTQLFYIYGSKINTIMTDVVVNPNNTLV